MWIKSNTMKKLTYTLTIIILTFQLQLIAQDFPWNAYFGGNGADFATDIKQTSDNGYIISGYGGDLNSSKYYVVKINLFGDLEWQQILNKDNYTEKAFSILETAEGEYVVVGSATSGNRPWVVKLNGSGEVIWTTEWTDQAPWNSALIARGTLLPDGRIVVVGAEGQYGSQPNMFIVSSEGQLLEQRSLVPIVPQGWLSGTFVNHIEATSDGGFILAGTAGSSTSSRAFLWKFDQNADSIWSRHYTGQNAWMRSAEHVSQLADGGFLLTGFDAPNGINSCAIRTDSQGNFVWFQVFPDNIYTQATAGIETNDGKLLITEKRYDGIGTSFYQSALLTTDPFGNLLSRQPIMASDSSTTITNMIKTNDGGFVLAGEINEYLVVNEQDLFVLKSDALGNISGVTLDYVWPGDVNYDGMVDMDDFMILGLTAGASGPARWNASIDWMPQYVTDWADTVVTGVNFKHADTDGNGVVAIDDTLAILVNYGQNRSIQKTHNASSAYDLDLFLKTEEAFLIEDQIVSIPVHLGSAEKPVEDIYGLSFNISPDTNQIVPSTVKIDFQNNWLGDIPATCWTIQQNAGNNTIDFGLTKIDQNMSSGSGLLGMLTFKLQQELNPGQTIILQLNINSLKAYQIDLVPLALSSGSFEIPVTNSITGVYTRLEDEITVGPNPTNRRLFFDKLKAGSEIRIYTLASQLINQWVASESHTETVLNNPGVYIIEIGKNQEIKRFKIVVR